MPHTAPQRPDPRPTLQLTERPGVLDLGWGHPRPDLLPVRAWPAAAQRAASRFGWQALTYGYGAGPGPLVSWLAGRLSTIDGPTGEDQTFITGGASHALDLVTSVLARPGDVVLVDSPTYHLSFPILRDHGVTVAAAPTDEDGIAPDLLEQQVARLRADGRSVPMLYLVPTFANPTGRSLPGPRRAALIQAARRAGVTLVEDDTYRELVYRGEAPPSLWREAGGAGVVRIGSFAKTVAPGLRLGWINAEPDLVRRLASRGYVVSGGGVNHHTALTMAEFGQSGAYAEHLTRIRAAYRRQRDILVDAVRDALGADSVTSPAGGWFLWTRLPAGMTASALLPVAERHGVWYAAGPQFFADGGVSDGRGEDRIRLSYSRLDEGDLAEAARRLGAAVQDVGAG